jgi:Fe-Mn family superoxide dismutase
MAMGDMARQLLQTPLDAGALNSLHGASLGGDGSMTPAVELALAASFASVARWRAGFVAMGKEHAGGSGWLCVLFQPQDASLRNQWLAEPAQGLVAGLPILALPMSGHAAGSECATAPGRQIEAFLDKVHWQAVYERYQQAVQDASAACGASQAELAGALVLDVRRAAVFKAAPTRMPGSRWLDPAEVTDWASGLPTDRKLIVYCVFGHEVSRATALRLRAAGLDAQYLRGGIDAWQTAGLALEAKETKP